MQSQPHVSSRTTNLKGHSLSVQLAVQNFSLLSILAYKPYVSTWGQAFLRMIHTAYIQPTPPPPPPTDALRCYVSLEFWEVHVFLSRWSDLLRVGQSLLPRPVHCRQFICSKAQQKLNYRILQDPRSNH